MALPSSPRKALNSRTIGKVVIMSWRFLVGILAFLRTGEPTKRKSGCHSALRGIPEPSMFTDGLQPGRMKPLRIEWMLGRDN